MDLDPRVNAFRAELADASLEGRVEAARFVRGEEARVISPSASVRKEPSASSMQVTEALCGEQAIVFDRTQDGWAWVQLAADRYVGWVAAEALSSSAPEPTHRVAALRTLVFARSDIKSPLLATLPFGAAVTVTGEAEDHNAHYALVAPAGAVVTQHLAPRGEVERDWPAVAARFTGTPYLWGGKTSLGIDCSGLIQLSLSACGIWAPRDTDMQEVALGAALPFAGVLPPLQRGDLVFWKRHAGIMLDGEMLLHANAHHMAVVAEPLRETIDRHDRKGLSVTSIRRIVP